MPLFRKGPEDAPWGPGADPLASNANLQQHGLTQELLDWLIKALESVIQTPEVRDLAHRRTQQALRDALKYADYLYPATVEVRRAARLHELANRETGVDLDGAHAARGGLAPDWREPDSYHSALDLDGYGTDIADGRHAAE